MSRGFSYRKAFIFAVAGMLALVGSILASGVRVVGAYSTHLQVIPFGFQYRGHPLTGIVYELYPGYRLAKVTVLFKGRRHGPEIYWYDNGQRWIERHYREGMEVGGHRAWYSDGNVRFLKAFSDKGVPHGEFYSWHSNGKLSEYVRFDHGQEVATKSWTGGGKPFYNYVWRDGRRLGLQGDTYCEPRKLTN